MEIGPVGAGFTALCLLTGSLWGKPMWGAWWVWDARLTSVLMLFFLYLGHIALVRAFDDPVRGYRAGAILALVGVVEPADHQIQRRLVEHAAPAGHHHADRRADHVYRHAVAAAVLRHSAIRWCSPPSCWRAPRAAVMERRIRALLMARADAGRRMTHLPYVAAAYALGVLIAGTFALMAFLRMRARTTARLASTGGRPQAARVTRKRRRLWILLACGLGPWLRHRAGAVGLPRQSGVLRLALADLASKAPPPGRTFRLGGLVEAGQRAAHPPTMAIPRRSSA